MLTSKLNDNKICIVAILKHEEKFLDEWLVYHRLLGVDHFFLYDDDPALPLESFLTPHSSYVTVIPWAKMYKKVQGGATNQLLAYRHALASPILPFQWVSFIDGDEFIVLREHGNLQSFLADFEGPAIALNWHTFGHNGFFDDPPSLITSSLLRRRAEPDPLNIKSITRTSAIEEILSPHFCRLKNGAAADANNKTYTEQLYEGKTQKAHINHYQCRSFTNWMARAVRGDVNFDSAYCPNEHKWRLTEQDCLKQFVTTVALDKNEYPDEFMLKYKTAIYENLYPLRRHTNILKQDWPLLSAPLKDEIDYQLQAITGIVMANLDKLDGIGLYDGKCGAVLYLFQYARYTGNTSYVDYANTLLNQIADSLSAELPWNYARGIAGFGALTEYLAQNCFIKANTDSILEDIDVLLHYQLKSQTFSNIDFEYGITGIGMYFIYRAGNHLNDPRISLNKTRKVIDEIIDFMAVPYNTYPEMLSVLSFLYQALGYSKNPEKVKAYINYAVDKMETMLLEDIHFNIAPGQFNSLSAALLLINASVKMNDAQLHKKAGNMLLDHEKFNYHALPVVTNGLNSLCNKSWLLHKELYNRFKTSALKDSAEKWLNICFNENTVYLNKLQKQELTTANLGVKDGLLGNGLSLISAVDEHESGWIHLFPFLN